MQEIRLITESELKDDGIITKQDFPEVVYLDSEDFTYDNKYLSSYKWYGVFEDNELICVAAVSESTKTEMCLELIESKPDWREQGYGRLMMDYLINDIYKDKDFNVWAMYKDLDKFYEKWGFTTIQKEPMLKMKLTR